MVAMASLTSRYRSAGPPNGQWVLLPRRVTRRALLLLVLAVSGIVLIAVRLRHRWTASPRPHRAVS